MHGCIVYLFVVVFSTTNIYLFIYSSELKKEKNNFLMKEGEFLQNCSQ